MKRCFVCHYHEISLKGGNRAFFENRLTQNIRQALRGLPHEAVRRVSGRIMVELLENSPVEEIGSRLQKVFGLVFSSPAWISGTDLEEIKANLWDLVSRREFETFKIHARRSRKDYPLNSQELNRLLGAFILEQSGAKVRLEEPDLTCHVDIVERMAVLNFERLPGVGGLPVSCSGNVVGLLSGGIDSPVAAYKMMKRGCRVTFVHFHSFPHTTLESQQKVQQLAQILTAYQYHSRLYMVPFAEAQRRIVAFAPPETRVVLYRRVMMRLAERIAQREKAHGLVTGDSLGQVASQTLENIETISRAVETPILRPLIGEDKEEIIRVARQIGTFTISTLPDTDCCSLFVPRHPETRANPAGIERVEEHLDLKEMIEDALNRLEIQEFEFRPETDAEASSF